jgi:hypothetical protein
VQSSIVARAAHAGAAPQPEIDNAGAYLEDAAH